ncbi:MAG: ABC transporter ATP-binding protein [Propionibacteriales bacterium]|nr:ABC transporter ATP-binding protein [Propionibacteriales bacterium]
MPAVFAVTMGLLVGAVQTDASLTWPLAALGTVFVLLQVLAPLHEAVSANLGSKLAAWLNDELAVACSDPPGIGHLEDPELTNDLTTAREFDLGMTGPPMFLNVGFIAIGMVEIVSGVASAVVLLAFSWWASPLLLGAWVSTHWLLRDSSIWKDRNTDDVRSAQRHADYAYRLAVDAAPGKELRLFGLQEWTIERFRRRRRRLFELQYEATRLRQRSVLLALLVLAVANGLVFWALGSGAVSGDLPLGRLVVYAQVAIGVSAVAFGSFNWALDGASAPVASVLRLRPAMAPAGALSAGMRTPDARAPRTELRVRDLRFTYPRTDRQIYDGLDLTVPAGSSLAIVGQNGAGKTTLAKLLCRLYDPDSGAIEVDGVDLRDLDVDAWRDRVTAVFQDFVRFDLPLRDNVAPQGAPDEDILAALRDAGAEDLADLDTPLAKGYEGGTDLSGGQWQRVALARALCAVRRGAGLVLLDEPTAQLDVRGEAAIFDRILEATRDVTTILISHRFSTVRHADRIAVLEHGRVIELGNHDELMGSGGRYRTMFELQASRFTATTDAEGVDYDVLA